MKKLFILLLLFLFSLQAVPCTTLFLEQSAEKIVGKNLDWPFGQGLVFINKRHVQKVSAFVNPARALKWTSKYMSLTFTQTGREFPWEGMNEAGLSVTIMMLDQTVFPPDTDPRPVINGLQWIQFILDTSSTVNEAIQNANHVRIGGSMKIADHYMICDLTGQCGTFEYLGGALVVHTGASLPFKALTNNTYGDSVKYLQNSLTTESPGQIMSSQSLTSLDRFSRAALMSKYFTPDKDAVSYAFMSLDNVKQTNPKWATHWNLVFSLAARSVYFRTIDATAIKRADLRQFNPSCRAPTKMLNINLPGSEDVSSQFTDYSAQANKSLTEMSTVPPASRPLIENYPDSQTRCLD